MRATVFIENVYNITGIGTVLVGKVKSGSLKVGMNLNINGKIMIVGSIEANHLRLEEAHAGESIAFSLSGGNYNTLKSIVKQRAVFNEGRSESIKADNID